MGGELFAEGAFALSRDLVHALDAAAFASDVLDFHPDEKQAALLRSRARRGAVCCTRQWGKSTTCAAKAAHECAYGVEPVVVIASPGRRQSEELRLKCDAFLSRCGPGCAIERRDPELGWFLRNGARVVALPGSEATVRGISAVTLLLVDEAARVPDTLRKALSAFLAVRNGAVWELSTPFGKRGFFWEHWQNGVNWERFSVPATECPRISPEFLEQERGDLGELWFRQEYLCEFIDVTDSAFNHGAILESVTDEVKPLFG
jgi:hypothetical protein